MRGHGFVTAVPCNIALASAKQYDMPGWMGWGPSTMQSNDEIKKTFSLERISCLTEMSNLPCSVSVLQKLA